MKITLGRLSCLALVFSLSGTLLTILSPRAVAQKQDHTPVVLSPQELFKRLSPSVFVVEVLDETGSLVATGSAVVVARDQVITNKHGIEAGVAFRIKQRNRSLPATVTYVDPDHDLGRLTVEDLKASAVPVRLSSALTVGEHVFCIGAPEGLELTISEGLISGLREFEQVRLIQTSAAISPGSSGGGLFDAQGQLVGITTFFLKEGQNLNFALPGEWVRAVASHRASLAEKNNTGSQADQALPWFQFGVQMMDATEYQKAVDAFREVVRLTPGESEAWSNLGVAYARLKQDDKAVAALQEAIRLRPHDAIAWSNLGVAYGRLKQDDKAVAALQEAIRLRPDDAIAWCNLGLSYDRLHEYKKATTALQEAIRLKPDYAMAWVGLGVAYGYLQQDDKAVAAFQEAIRLEPDYAEAWYNLGVAYEEQHDRSRVMTVYEKLKSLDQDEADKFFRRVVLP